MRDANYFPVMNDAVSMTRIFKLTESSSQTIFKRTKNTKIQAEEKRIRHRETQTTIYPMINTVSVKKEPKEEVEKKEFKIKPKSKNDLDDSSSE